MATDAERRQFYTYEKQISTALEGGNPVGAFGAFDEMLNGDMYPYPTYYANVTGMGSNYFNFRQGADGSSLTKNVTRVEIRSRVEIRPRVEIRSRVGIRSCAEI